ncbi:MAG: FliA/WhiG family RNA polymerase sigma factor [Balneola sp.]
MDLQNLVSEYKANPTSSLKNHIVKESIPLIKNIVGKVNSPNSPLCGKDDLINIGATGLLQALDNYTLDKEVKFNTFAYYRIRGSIIDYLRSVDELSRTNRARYGSAQETTCYLQQKLGRNPLDHEVAEEMELELNDYHKLLSKVQQRVALSLDVSISSDSESSLSERIEDLNFELPDQSIINEEDAQQLKHAIKSLTEREQIILALYYYEECTLREIAESLSLSEARISQIIGKMLVTLKATLKELVLV